MVRFYRLLPGVLAAAGVLAGCVTSTTSSGPASHPGGSQAASAGDLAPDIVGTDQDGKDLKLSDFRGKVVLLDFWSTS